MDTNIIIDDQYKINEIKINLNKNNFYNLSELNQIALSLGLQPSKYNEDLENRILNFISFKQQFLNEQESYYNLNQFREPFQPLSITNNIESQELLFWRIFRDKYLFKKIFNNFIFKNICSYKELNNVPKILNFYSNGEQILREKIRLKENLSFNIEGFVKIFSKFSKNTKENQLFYNQLFKSYGDQFSKKEFFFEYIIDNGSIFLFEQFIQFFNLSTHEIKEILSKSYSQRKFLINDYKRFKIFNYLQLNFQQPNNVIFQGLGVINDSIPGLYRFKHFLKVIGIIISNKYFGKFLNEYKESIEGFELFKQQFTNEQLNLTTKQFILQLSKYDNQDQSINKKNKQLKESINKLAKIYFNLIKYEMEYHFIYFFDEDQISPKDKIIQKYQHFEYFLNKYENKKEKIEFLFSLLGYMDTIHKSSKLLHRLVKYGDIELIDFLIKEKEIGKVSNYGEVFTFKFYGSIRSTKVFEYFITNKCYQNSILMDRNENWKFIKSKEVLEYYENQMLKLDRKFLVIGIVLQKIFRDDTMLLRLKRSIENPSLYDIPNDIFYGSFQNLFAQSFKTAYPLIISIFKSGIFKKIDANTFYAGCENKFALQNISNWIIDNCKQPYPKIKEFTDLELKLEFTNDDGKLINITISIYLKYFIQILTKRNKLKECYQSLGSYDNENFDIIIKSQKSTQINNESIREFINYYINYYENTNKSNLNQNLINNFKKTFSDIFYSSICSTGKLESLKFIIANYSFILNIHDTKYGGPFLDYEKLYESFALLIINNYSEMIEILLPYFANHDRLYKKIKTEFLNQINKNSSTRGWGYFKKLIKSPKKNNSLL